MKVAVSQRLQVPRSSPRIWLRSGNCWIPDVRWGASDDSQPGCQNRDQVLACYRRGRDAGVRASVTEVTVADDKVLVDRGEAAARSGLLA